MCQLLGVGGLPGIVQVGDGGAAGALGGVVGSWGSVSLTDEIGRENIRLILCEEEEKSELPGRGLPLGQCFLALEIRRQILA